MYWNRFFFLLSLFIATKAQTQEAPTKPAAAAPSTFSGKQNEEWMAAQTQLITVKGKVENQQKLIENLIVQKDSLKGREQLEKIETLKKEHIVLVQLIEHYNSLSLGFQTKYPEKGAALGRIYKRIDPTNIETIESRMTLEGRLKRLNSKIKKQYGKDSSTAQSPGTNAQSPTPLGTAKKDDGIQVTDQIILQK